MFSEIGPLHPTSVDHRVTAREFVAFVYLHHGELETMLDQERRADASAGLASAEAPTIRRVVLSGRQRTPERWASRHDEVRFMNRAFVQVFSRRFDEEDAEILAELAAEYAGRPFFTEIGEGIEQDRPY